MRSTPRLLLFIALVAVTSAAGGFFAGRGAFDFSPSSRAGLTGEGQTSNSGPGDGAKGGESGAAGAAHTPEEIVADRRGRSLAALMATRRQANYLFKMRDASVIANQLALEDIPAALEAVQKLNRYEGRMLISLIVGRWADLDPNAAAEFVSKDKLMTSWERDSVLSTVATAWAKRDQKAAQAWALALGDPQRIRSAVAGIASGILESNPAAALSWLKGLPPEVRQPNVYHQVFREWAVSDPLLASQQAMTMPTGTFRTMAIDGLMGSWSEKDPQAAFDWAKNLPDFGQRANALRAAFSQWGQQDPEAAGAEAGKLPPGPLRNQAYSALMAGVASKGSEAALKFAEEIPAGPQRSQALNETARELMYRNPKAAVEVVFANVANPQRKWMLEDSVSVWAQSAPADAMNYIQQNMPGGSARKKVEEAALNQWSALEPKAAIDWMVKNGRTSPEELATVVKGWAQQNPTGALAWARSRPEGPERAQTESSAIAGLANYDPTRAAEEFLKLPDGDFNKGAAGQVAAGLAQQDPAAAAKWAGQLGNEKVRSEAYRSLAATWAGLDLQQSAAWLEKLPADASRDTAIGAYVDVVANVDPVGAAAWAETIGDQDDRERVLKSIFENWKQADEKAAINWLDHHATLSPDKIRAWKK